MTREECEQAILEKMKEIQEIYKQYNPNANYLSLCMVDGYYHVNNRYWSDEEKYPIEFSKIQGGQEDGK